MVTLAGLSLGDAAPGASSVDAVCAISNSFLLQAVSANIPLTSKHRLKTLLIRFLVTKERNDQLISRRINSALPVEAPSNFSGAIEGRPMSEYISSNSGDLSRNALSTMLRIARKGGLFPHTFVWRKIAEHTKMGA